MIPVFLDTVGLISLWDQSDQWHVAAEQAFRQLAIQKTPLLSTTYILLECGNSAARRPYRSAVTRLRESLETAGLLVFPTEEDWKHAWAAYQRAEFAQAGIVDNVSFVVMRKLGLTQAFTNDAHFKAAGFETLF